MFTLETDLLQNFGMVGQKIRFLRIHRENIRQQHRLFDDGTLAHFFPETIKQQPFMRGVLIDQITVVAQLVQKISLEKTAAINCIFKNNFLLFRLLFRSEDQPFIFLENVGGLFFSLRLFRIFIFTVARIMQPDRRGRTVITIIPSIIFLQRLDFLFRNHGRHIFGRFNAFYVRHSTLHNFDFLFLRRFFDADDIFQRTGVAVEHRRYDRIDTAVNDLIVFETHVRFIGMHVHVHHFGRNIDK